MRQQAIRLREQGKQIVDIAQYLGVHRSTGSDRWHQYQQEGEAALEQQRAKREDAEIAWGNEPGLRSDAQVGRGYPPVGETPNIRSNTQRARINYIASIDNQGTVRFMLYSRKLTAQVFILLLERLIAQRKRKMVWIVDRHPVQRS